MIKGKYKSVFFTVFLVLGLFLALQFRTTIQQKAQEDTASDSINEIMAQLETEKELGINLKNELLDLQNEKEAYIQSLKTGQDLGMIELLNNLEEAKLKAGLTPVKGPGVVITLNDAPARTGTDPVDLIIHDFDIVLLLNELKKAGAQAIAIEGERIIATSKQICAGPTILINNTRYAVPYEIEAIGDPEILKYAMEGCRAVVIMRMYDIQVDIQKQDEININRYQMINPDYMFSGMEVVSQ